jgi:small subunit ribosomal protein SAe
MQNEAGEYVDLYIPRKCSASNRVIPAKDYASIQINIADIDEATGRMTGAYKTKAICGAIRRMGESDDCINRLAKSEGAVTGQSDVLQIKEDDIKKMLAATTHLGSENSETTMEQYIWKRRPDGINIINLKTIWEKLVLAARVVACIENPEDVYVVSSRNYGQRACLKFARYIGATAIAGRFTPGTFTNQSQSAYREPRLLIITDPRADQQPITESSYANIPVISFCNADSPTKFIDIVIPCNNKSSISIGLMWWFLAREVLRLRGSISREFQWEVMPDLFFWRDPEEAEKEEGIREDQRREAAHNAAVAAQALEKAQPPKMIGEDDWGGAAFQGDNDWGGDWAQEVIQVNQ